MSKPVAELFGLAEDSPRLEEALTHPSFANESRGLVHNQRLEFLGDAVLELCSSEELWERFPKADEGELTRRRAQLVNTDALADFARQSGVAESLRLGKGAEASGLRDSSNVLADAVEALIAAAYLDGGLQSAKVACRRVIADGLRRFAAGHHKDAKSTLQEAVQALGHGAPQYAVIDSGGPDHERWFEVEVSVSGNCVGRGKARSKRQAEMAAAQQALDSNAITTLRQETNTHDQL